MHVALNTINNVTVGLPPFGGSRDEYLYKYLVGAIVGVTQGLNARTVNIVT
jgi:hypothetical protein